MTAALLNILPRQSVDQIGWGVLLSLGLHLLLVAVLMFWPGFMNKRQIFAPVYQVNLVGAPRLPVAPSPAPQPAPGKAKDKPALKPPAKPKPKPKPKEAIGTKETVKPKPLKRKSKPKKPTPDLSKKLENKLKRLRSKVAEKKRLDSALNRIEQRVAARGPSTSGAMAPAGAGAQGQLSLRFQIYYTERWERLRRHWVLPEALVEQTKGLTTVIVMRIKRDGSLEKVWLEKGSGNSRFDQSCLRAAERGAPFPPLPPEVRSSSHEVGVRFRAEDLEA
ncbi:MAG: energy transducer TonB [Desulfarculaceae bacterium]